MSNRSRKFAHGRYSGDPGNFGLGLKKTLLCSLALGDLQLQLLVGVFQVSRSLFDSPIELIARFADRLLSPFLIAGQPTNEESRGHKGDHIRCVLRAYAQGVEWWDKVVVQCNN